jgi:endonuclease G, mitochondrial
VRESGEPVTDAIELQTRISYPRNATVGSRYLISVDLDHVLPPDKWPYKEEEYPVTCFLDAAPFFEQQAAGESTIVVHRFGGSYGPARFWVTAREGDENGEAAIRLVFVNGAGVPVAARTLDDIKVGGQQARVALEAMQGITDAIPNAYQQNAYQPNALQNAAADSEATQQAFRTFRWLHLSDLKFGNDRGPRIRVAELLRAKATREHPIDAVIISGDLAYQGRESEYEEAGRFYEEIRETLYQTQGFAPALLAIPGNHDADTSVSSRRPADSAWVEVEDRKHFYPDEGDVAGSYRAFSPFMRWLSSHLARYGELQGMLPGDFAVSMVVNGLKVGVVGLNDVFLRLPHARDTRGDVQDAQLRAVCGDPLEWAGRHDLRILVTHHDPGSMPADKRKTFYSTIAPRSLFDIHIYGLTRNKNGRAEIVNDGDYPLAAMNGIRLDGSSIQGFSIGEARLPGDDLTVTVSGFVTDKSPRSIRELPLETLQLGRRPAIGTPHVQTSQTQHSPDVAQQSPDSPPVSGVAEQEEAAKLVLRIHAGDATAEAELIKRFEPGVLEILNRQLRDRELARDLCQDTFELVLKRLRTSPLHEPSRIAAFVAQTARQLAIAAARKSRRRKSSAVTDEFLENSAPADEEALESTDGEWGEGAEIYTGPVTTRCVVLAGFSASEENPEYSQVVSISKAFKEIGFDSVLQIAGDKDTRRVLKSIERTFLEGGPGALFVVVHGGDSFEDRAVKQQRRRRPELPQVSGRLIFALAHRIGCRMVLIGDFEEVPPPSGCALVRRVFLRGGSQYNYGALLNDNLRAARENRQTVGQFVRAFTDAVQNPFISQVPKAEVLVADRVADLPFAGFEPAGEQRNVEPTPEQEVDRPPRLQIGFNENHFLDFRIRRPSARAPGKEPSPFLAYRNFTLQFNLERSLAWFAAVNVDMRTRIIAPARTEQTWQLDSHLPPEAQLNDEFFKNGPFDRMRLVRRLQPAWGDPKLAQMALEATSYYSNVMPLTPAANQNTLWFELPDYIATHHAQQQRLSMITGPWLQADDPKYRGVQIPLGCWRLLAYVDHYDRRCALAFMTFQTAWSPRMPRVPKYSRELPTRPLVTRVSISTLARLTGLDFDELMAADLSPESAEATTKEGLPGEVVTDIELANPAGPSEQSPG